jgi:adenylate cyclase
MTRRRRVPGWLVATAAVAIGANVLANYTTGLTIEFMGGVSEVARASRRYELMFLPWYRTVAYAVLAPCVIAYLWPITRWAPARGEPVPGWVQRRVVSAPLVVAVLGFVGWVGSIFLFPLMTLWRDGRWSPDLMSQQILSPLVSGFLAATCTYLLVDLVFRRRVVPEVFPDGRLSEVSGALTLSVRGRLVAFLVAVGFVPLFTLFGLVRAAVVRLAAGMPVEAVVPELAHASAITFGVFLVLGTALTIALARTFTEPLGALAGALRRIRAGDLSARVAVTAGDEVGVLEDGVNALAGALRERDRILRAFGRVVDPAVRDRLLADDARPGGELRTVTVLFSDLRDFTGLAARTPAPEVVATLNEFFGAMTEHVRAAGGFVDKFIGDAVLAVFGLFDPDDAEHRAAGAAAALRCADGMRAELARLNGARAGMARPPLALKIGVHTGPVVAGTIGAADRHDYTVIGDTVNVAARLEQLCRQHGCDLLVSEITHRLAAAGGEPRATVMQAAVALRGRDEPVAVVAPGSTGGSA